MFRLDFWRGGNYTRAGGGVANRLLSNYDWSNNARSSDDAYFIDVFVDVESGTGRFYPISNYRRGAGYFIRCARIEKPNRVG